MLLVVSLIIYCFSFTKICQKESRESSQHWQHLVLPKKVKHRDEEIAIQMQLEAVATLFECENCEKFFKSPQASNPKRKFRSSTVLHPLHRKLDSSFENIEISISQA